MKPKTTIISVGAFTVDEVSRLLPVVGTAAAADSSRAVINAINLHIYDPRHSVASSFAEKFVNDNRVTVYQEAVSDSNGVQRLSLKGTESSLLHIDGDDTQRIDVMTTSLIRAVNRVTSQHDTITNPQRIILVMNCEGEEIPIILNTPLDVFENFSDIKVEFHPDVYIQQGWNPGDKIKSCVERLSKIFRPIFQETSVKKQPVVVFVRK